MHAMPCAGAAAAAEACCTVHLSCVHIQVTMACYAIRMFAYAALPAVGVVWAVLPVEVSPYRFGLMIKL